MKYEAIRGFSQEFTVGKMCKVLNLTSGSYYQWLKRMEGRENKRKAEQESVSQIVEIFETNRKTYGYRRMYQAMLEKGYEISEYKVRKHMREAGLYPVTRVKYKAYHYGKKTGRYFENKVNREFRPEGFNEIWAGDITYIKTALGWVYLSVVMDLYNREVVGYSVSKSIDTELVKRALGNALARTAKGSKEITFHSDRGTQYCSKGFQKMLIDNGFEISMSRPGCPYDNACVESFFSTAKRECIYRREYVTIEEVKRDLFVYIELFYNRKRMHRTLGYKSPIEYRLSKLA